MKTKKKDLTYEIICAAINGSDEAEEFIFDYYEPYIIKLSKIPFINERDEIVYRIDEDIYMALRMKLHDLILNFNFV